MIARTACVPPSFIIFFVQSNVDNILDTAQHVHFECGMRIERCGCRLQQQRKREGDRTKHIISGGNSSRLSPRCSLPHTRQGEGCRAPEDRRNKTKRKTKTPQKCTDTKREQSTQTSETHAHNSTHNKQSKTHFSPTPAENIQESPGGVVLMPPLSGVYGRRSVSKETSGQSPND